VADPSRPGLIAHVVWLASAFTYYFAISVPGIANGKGLAYVGPAIDPSDLPFEWVFPTLRYATVEDFDEI
jgi:hypothetical protein